MFSVHVLCYGNNRDYASRCLVSLLRAYTPSVVAEFRIGLNAVSPELRKIVDVFARTVRVPCHIYSEVSGQNVLKYPLMRRMFYDHERPLAGDSVMWFDDDSFVSHDKIEDWFVLVRSAWLAAPTSVLGSIYYPGYKWTGREMLAIGAQPWCTNSSSEFLQQKPRFATGGWWVANREFLSQWDYPFRELKHNGGDVILGELCRQQSANLVRFNTGVGINAALGLAVGPAGKESSAKRRGVTTPRPYEKPPPYSYDHHKFDVSVTSYGGKA